MSQEIPFRKVPIQPVDCLTQAKDLMGEQLWLFVGICFVGLFLGSIVPFGILMGPMMCGIYLCFLQRMQGYQVSFELLFKGFDYFVESLIATLIMIGVTLALMIPLYVLMFAAVFGAGMTDSEVGPLIMVVVMLFFYAGALAVSLVVGALFAFAYLLIVDRNVKAIPAIKSSFRGVWANLPGVLGLFALNALLGVVAMMLCVLPIFVVMPICMGAIAVAYRKVFGEPPASELPPPVAPPPVPVRAGLPGA